MTGTPIFLLPHQDDEFGVFHLLDRTVASGCQPLIVYVTDGAFGKTTAQTRNAESMAVLQRLGVDRERIWFLGQDQAVPNTGLRQHLKAVYSSLLAFIEGMAEPIGAIYSPAFEGGHPDHDAAALLAVALGKRLDIPEHVWQFPLYNAYRCALRPYRVLTPVVEAGPVVREKIPSARRAEHLSLCLRYPSQARTFLGLLPFILAHYLSSGTQQLQPLRASTISARPHNGPLLYERRGWLTWESFETAVGNFRNEMLS